MLILPMAIQTVLSSDVIIGSDHLGYAIALEMVVIITLVMIGYSLLLRRTSKWLSLEGR